MAELHIAAWMNNPAVVLLAFGALLWTLAVVVHVLRSPRKALGKLGWCAVVVLLMPLGGVAYHLFGRGKHRARLASTAYLIMVGAIFAAAVIAAAVQQLVDVNFRMTLLGALSVITFLAYGYDKLSAGSSATRVPERTLHALTLAGGFAGGWLGMFALRHKINWRKHWLFPVTLLLATALHAAAAMSVITDIYLALGVALGFVAVWVFGGSARTRR